MPKKTPDKEFVSFIKQNHDKLWHICKGFSLSPAWETEDAFQEVVCALWQNWQQADRYEKSKGWMMKVAYHTLLNIKRQHANQPINQINENMPCAISYPDDSDIIFIQMTELLPKKLRDVVVARWQGFDYYEISRMLGITVISARQRHYRGIKKIRELYEKNI